MRYGKTKRNDDPDQETLAVVRRIVASEGFAGSDQLKKFLQIAVERTLHGQERDLKEYTLGVEVFGRPESYDPRMDPIVRVQARRLRAKLEEYYRRDGRNEKLLIRLPKGSYVPVFESRGQTKGRRWTLIMGGTAGLVSVLAVAYIITGGQRTDAYSLAVLPFVNLTGDPAKEFIADKMTEGLITELGKNSRLRVKSRTTTMQYKGARRGAPGIARELNVAALVEGGIAIEGSNVMIKARLVSAASDTKMWADSYVRPIEQLAALPSEMAQAIAAAAIRSANSRPSSK